MNESAFHESIQIIKKGLKMDLKKKLRGTAELAASMTIIATLLSACGGGGSSAATAGSTAGTLINIVAFLGQYSSGTATIYDNAHVAVPGATGPIVNGVAQVSLAALNALTPSQYPLTVEVTGSYYNELTKATESGGAAVIRGVIPNPAAATAAVNAASGIPVTPLTEIAVSSLPTQSPATPLTEAQVKGALSQAETTLGLSQGAAQRTPVFAANNTTTDPQTLFLSALSLAAHMPGNGATPGATMAASIKALANTLTLGASAPAAAPAMLNLAAAMTAVSVGGTSSVTGGASVVPPAYSVSASSVAQIVAQTAAVTTANSFLIDVTAGMRQFFPGSKSPNQNRATQADLITSTLSNAVYTAVVATKELLSLVGWTVPPAGSLGYVLTSTGWTDWNKNGATFTVNADGTLTLNQPGQGTQIKKVVQTSASGVPFSTGVAQLIYKMVAQNSMTSGTWTTPSNASGTVYMYYTNVGQVPFYGDDVNKIVYSSVSGVAPVPVNGLNALGQLEFDASGVLVNNVTPTGSWTSGNIYTMSDAPNSVATQDTYELWSGGLNTLTGIDGNLAYAVGTATPLTAMPTTTPFCFGGMYLAPTTTAVPGTVSVAVSWSGTATTSTSACTSGGMAVGTATVTSTTVNGQSILTVTTGAGNLAVNNILSLDPAGKVRGGRFIPTGTLWSTIKGGGGHHVNAAAATQFFKALNLPAY
jgi:hypothetical protein